MSISSREYKQALKKLFPLILTIGIIVMIGATYGIYSQFRIDVPAKHIAVLIKKTGKDLENDMECAPDESYKGVQKTLLTEGRYFYNCYDWDWEVHPMEEVSGGELAVKVRLYGDNLGYSEFVVSENNQKGIIGEVLRPGRYAIHPYLERIHRYKPITIPAGYKGVVTNLSAPISEDPNTLLAEEGKRGVQEKTLDPGTYYVNPFVQRINDIDCRSQRYNLSDESDMGFPSKDGFWVNLDGIIEFRVNPDRAAEVFTIYNDEENDTNGETVSQEIIEKIILPNARTFCRMNGSNRKGRDFIDGDTRVDFQLKFQKAMVDACEPLGIEIVQALITKIYPPQAIAEPVRKREIARQTLGQYKQEIIQQESEKNLAAEKAKVEQKQELQQAAQQVAIMTIAAEQKQDVAITQANKELSVAKLELEAAKDSAEAIRTRGKAIAEIIRLDNAAVAAGWLKSINAFGSGEEYSNYVLRKKMAPNYKKIMTNTNDSPLMEMFKSFNKTTTPKYQIENKE